MGTKKPVKTKLDFVRRYRAGEFGNAAPTWETFDELLASGYQGFVHFRNRTAGGPTWYNVSVADTFVRYAYILANGLAKEDDLYFSGMAPTERTLFQGEVRADEEHYSLTYSLLPLTMRQALATDARYAKLTEAVILLRYFLCGNSYDWLMYLLESYPGHTIEFSTYSVNWGTVPRFNTVFWEVRQY